MTILSTIERLASAYRQHRIAARTRRMIGALPEEVQKDIGWPEGREFRRGRLSSRDLPGWHF